MNKKGIWAVYFSLLAIFLVLLFIFSLSIVNSKPASSKISPEIYKNLSLNNKIQENTEIKVFVKLETNDQLGINNKDKQTDMEKMKEVINRLGNKKFKIRHTFDGMFSASLTLNDLKNLENDPNVKSIEPVYERKIFLSSSGSLINATISHSVQVNGINLTGIGQTICILDTGVNYSHSSLGGCLGNNNISSGCKVIGGHDFVNNDNDPYDDHGHGTHVAGIAAANGSIVGVAPGAKIIMIKVCNSGGSCGDDDIIAGMQWCNNNATALNISVISMSLGADCETSPSLCYNSYCNSDPLASYINTAVGRNITVAIASGNDYNKTHISSPACVQNATAVGSTTKADVISDFSNMNSLVNLVAPGESIVSTSKAGGSTTLSGTSMATPHVAGAIAILNQYIVLQSQQRKSPKTLESILNLSGLRLSEVSSSRNYSRINVYNATILLDLSSPVVNLVSPSTLTSSLNTNQSFRCNATDFLLHNVTFFLWNSTSVYNQTTKVVSGGFNLTEFNVTNIPTENYNWNCLFYDENNNSAFATSNFTLTITQVSINLLSPSNNLNTNTNQTFLCNASSTSSLSNATFFLWNSTGLENSSFVSLVGLSNSSNFTYNFTHEDSYNWNCKFVNNLSVESFALSNFSIIYDTTKPTLSIISPINNSWQNKGQFNITLNENGSCLYSLNQGAINYSLSSSNYRDFNATNSTLSDGSSYDVIFYCNDSANNLNTSRSFFKIDLTSPNVTSLSPENGFSTTGDTTISFEYNVSDNLNLTRCSLILNGAIAASNSSLINLNTSNTISYAVSSGSYTWNINCTDEATNSGNSSSRSFTINSASVSSGGSGGGGGGGGGGAQTSTAVYEVKASDLSGSGYTKELKKGDKITFEISPLSSSHSASNNTNKSIKHTLTINSVETKYVNITLRSSPVNLILFSGESKKINLTSPTFYDLLVRVDSIINNKTSLTIRAINEPIALVNDLSIDSNTINTFSNESINNVPSNSDNYSLSIIFGIIMIIIIFIVVFVIRSRLHKKKSKKKN